MTARILLAALILTGTVALAWYGTRWVNRMGHPAPTQPDEPDEREGHEDPVEHEGATVEWGAKLKAIRDMPAAPELISDTEMDLAWGLLWHQFEHDMKEEINRVFAPLLAALPVAEDFDELRELVAA